MITSENQYLTHPAGNTRNLSRRQQPDDGLYRNGGKRLLDIAASAFALVILTPLLVVVASIIYLYDRGKPIFVHKRVGQDGNSFGCLKLRSMEMNAEERLNDLLAASPEARAEWEESQKLDNDPRITRVGNFLRKTSLDELPQLLNVLRGEMSLVGPRPIVQDELARYGEHATSYLSLRPGLTGPWQTTGRNDVSYDERVQMDVAYAREITLMEDLRIMVMTVVTMLRRTGK
ncbi:sugar transferase [Paracoccus aurantiacus]|uniref:Sugar transferase n=1 Tax=Paracoccus aurantiacus TaxID=2599412 RepID=A0A5C6S266_9RHOB|nr:sugar transferase [Paracoccus aurantiacus]TXB67712.1 sugar transferase [Paracoccus aurantiacus]